MKKVWLLCTLVTALLLSVIPYPAMGVSAQTTDNGLVYTISDRQAVITQYTGTDKVVDVPAYIDGYAVTEIGKRAFKDSKITQLILPEGLLTVGDEAFLGCTALTHITLPDTLVSIGEFAFGDTGYFTNESNWEKGVLYIGNHCIKAEETLAGTYQIKEGTRSIANCAFEYCDDLVQVVLPEGVAAIGNRAFYGCEAMSAITLGEGLLTIGAQSFEGCEKLEEIHLPDSVVSIGKNCFVDCSALTRISIGPQLQTVGEYAFGGDVEELKRVDIQSIESWCNIQFDNIYANPLANTDSATGAAYRRLYVNGEPVTRVDLPQGMTEIKPYTFAGCCGLEEVTVPKGVTVIGTGAFMYCDQLTGISLPKTLVTIQPGAFSWCVSLTEITIPSSVRTIGDSAFYATNGAQIVIPDSVTAIGDMAFYTFSETFVSIVVPDSVTEIGEDAFAGGYLTVYGYDGSYVQTYALQQDLPFVVIDRPAPPFETVQQEDGLMITKYTGDGVYVVIPEQIEGQPVVAIENGAFSDLEDVLSITVPDSVLRIEDGSFANYSASFKILGGAGSAAQRFADENGIGFALPDGQLPYSLGDLNDDTKIDANDALIVLKMAVDKLTPTPAQKLAADVNQDGSCNAGDALEILKKAVGRPACF